MNVDEIKQKFPKPMTAAEGKCRPNTYCVGGAFCMAVGLETRFPVETTIAIAIRDVNPELDYITSHYYANAITRANDRGDFNTAWEHLRRALQYFFDTGSLSNPETSNEKH